MLRQSWQSNRVALIASSGESTVKTVTTVEETRRAVADARREGRGISFVPTMGALHDGHLSLVEIARARGSFCVMSIFVNPTQFNSADDLAKYPRMLQADEQRAEAAGVDLVFAPAVEEIYPSSVGFEAACRIQAGSKAEHFEGPFRPGHFDGVVTVVAKLFNIVLPDVAVFGQKDFQQVQVIRQMVSDLCFPVEIVTGKTVREIDGLAMSSRNLRLSAEQRFRALLIPRALEKARDLVKKGERNAAYLSSMVRDNLERSQALRVDYVEIVEPTLFERVETISGEAQMLVAAYVDDIRLIDNMLLTE